MIDLGWLARVAASTVVRKLTLVALVAVLAWAGIGRADAAVNNPCGSYGTRMNCTQASAYAIAQAIRDEAVAASPTATVVIGGPFAEGTGGFYYRVARNGSSIGSAYYGNTSASCPAGQTLSSGGLCQCPGGYPQDPFNTQQCLDADKCQARNAALGTGSRTMTGISKCVAGCLMTFPGDYKRVQIDGNMDPLFNGVARYTGPSCATPAPPTTEEIEVEKTPKPQECQPGAGSLTSVCVKANGERCHSTSSGFQQCWQPGETGEKTQGDTKQVTNAGPNAIVPALTLTNGDTLVQKNPPTTVTTTNNSGGTTTITTTTTTTNYNTSQGTNAGPKGTDTGEKDDGTGSAMPGDGEDGKTASGGQNCEPSGAPVVNGDAHLQMVATQAWATRCAVESKDAVTSTGEIGDCSSNFTLTGPAKSAELIKLKGLRETICGVDKNLKDGDPNGPGSVDGVGLEGDITDTPFAGIVGEGDAVGADGLNDQGFGFSRACPSMPSVDVFGTTVQFDNSIMCDWLALAGMFVLALAALASVKILAMGGNV